MKIDLTKSEYKKLIEMLFLADWMMNAFDSEPRADTEPYFELEQKILAHAKDFGFGKLVDKEDGIYYPSKQFEDDIFDKNFIDEYDEKTFWDLLSDKLALRDLIEKYPQYKETGIPDDEAAVNEINEKKSEYEKEFETNEVSNLRIVAG